MFTFIDYIHTYVVLVCTVSVYKLSYICSYVCIDSKILTDATNNFDLRPPVLAGKYGLLA